jgi:hypothetical protein
VVITHHSSEIALARPKRGGHRGPPVQWFSLFGAVTVAAMSDSHERQLRAEARAARERPPLRGCSSLFQGAVGGVVDSSRTAH